MIKTTWYFSDLGRLIQMIVWLRKPNQLFWIQKILQVTTVHIFVLKEQRAQPDLCQGRKGSLWYLSVPCFPAGALVMGGPRSTQTDEGTLAQLLRSPTRSVSRKNKALNPKQLREVATGDPRSQGTDWPTALAKAAASKNILQAPREEWAWSATHR